MNIEQEPGDVLPPVGGQQVDAEPAKAAQNRGRPSPRALETKEPASDSGKSRKSKESAANGDAVDGQTATTPKPVRTKSVKASKSDTKQLDERKAQPPAEPKPRRSRAKSVSKDASPPHSSLSTSVEHKSSETMPPITDEAIAFLRDPDAKAADLFKLASESQAFVRYHITNMQRLEAASALTHAHLLATARKYSPRFEKAVDVLVSKLARERPSLVEAPAMRSEPKVSNEAGAAKLFLNFGPGQPAATVRLSPKKSAVGLTAVHGFFHENSIELGTSHEQTPHSAGTAESTMAKEKDAAASSAPVTSSGRRRLLGGIEAAVQTASIWLHDKARSIPSSIRPSAPISKAESASPVIDRSTIIPEEVSRRFLKVDRDYYFFDRTPAFSDQGTKLATRGEHPEVIRSLVDIAVARGWDGITVKGAESFRRAAWMQASQSGMKVVGYQPTALDLAELANRPASNSVEKTPPKDRSRDVSQNLSAKKTKEAPVAHGTSTLHKHVAETTNPEVLAKTRSFDKDKPISVVKKHPDLAPAYGVIDAAKKFADSNLPEEAREEFVGLARRHVINKIISGEAIVGPKVYMAREKMKYIAATATMNTSNNHVVFAEAQNAKDLTRER